MHATCPASLYNFANTRLKKYETPHCVTFLITWMLLRYCSWSNAQYINHECVFRAWA
jgi:hypothetical protein